MNTNPDVIEKQEGSQASAPWSCCAALVSTWRQIAKERIHFYLKSPDESWAKVNLHQAAIFERCALELERQMEAQIELIDEAMERTAEVLDDTESQWECGCGTVNGINLRTCAVCNRQRGEAL